MTPTCTRALRPTLASTLFAAALTTLALAPALSGAAEEKTPEIMGKTMNGALFKLSSLRGTPVVLNFFSVNCIPCREEMPELAAKAKQYPKVHFVSVHVDDIDDDQVVAWVKKLPAAPPTIVLAGHRVQQVYGTNNRGLPETHLINSQGKIVQSLSGYTPKTTASIRAWLAQQH